VGDCPAPTGPPPSAGSAPRAELYQLLAALADRVEELEAERLRTRRRLDVLVAALTRLADDEYQPPGAQHVATVIRRHLRSIHPELAEAADDASVPSTTLGIGHDAP
jgi:hypothetical protein